MDIPIAVNGLMGAVRTVLDLTKSWSELKSSAEIASATLDLTRHLIDVQSQALQVQADYTELLRTKERLEKELDHWKLFEEEKKSYELREVSLGTFVHTLTEPSSRDPLHYLCTSCFQNGIKSILQFSGNEIGGRKQFGCHICNASFLFEKSGPSITTVPIRIG